MAGAIAQEDLAAGAIGPATEARRADDPVERDPRHRQRGDPGAGEREDLLDEVEVVARGRVEPEDDLVELSRELKELTQRLD